MRQYKEGVYYSKNGRPVTRRFSDVDKDRLIIIGKYCRFYLSLTDLGKADFEGAQKNAASIGDGWRCPDSFEGRTIGLMHEEIEKAVNKLEAKFPNDIYWFWTNEYHTSSKYNAWCVDLDGGCVGSYDRVYYYGSVVSVLPFLK